jgi:hypothetical protein
VPIGVTKPKRATLEPGPVGGFAWKPIKPGYSRGFRESYKAEIKIKTPEALSRLCAIVMWPNGADGQPELASLCVIGATGTSSLRRYRECWRWMRLGSFQLVSARPCPA